MRDYFLSVGFIILGIIGTIYFLNKKRGESSDFSLSGLKHYEGLIGSMLMLITGILYLIDILGFL